MSAKLYMLGFWMWEIVSLFGQSTTDSSAAGPASRDPQSLNMGWLLIKTIGILVLIVVLIIVSVHLLKKYVFNGSGSMKDSGWIQILGQFQIQPKKHLALVKVLDRVLLVGVTDSSIQTLAEFDDLSGVQPMLERLQTGAGSWQESRFFGMIKKKLQP